MTETTVMKEFTLEGKQERLLQIEQFRVELNALMLKHSVSSCRTQVDFMFIPHEFYVIDAVDTTACSKTNDIVTKFSLFQYHALKDISNREEKSDLSTLMEKFQSSRQ